MKEHKSFGAIARRRSFRFLTECRYQIHLLSGPDLHFGSLQGIVVTFPGWPHDATKPRNRSPNHVYPIQMTFETALKPPGTIPFLSTVNAALEVLIFVPGRETLTTVHGSVIFVEAVS